MRRVLGRAGKKALLYLALLLSSAVFMQSDASPVFSDSSSGFTPTSISQETDADGITWNVVSAGNDLSSLLDQSPIGSTLHVKASTDLTIGLSTHLYSNTSLVLDMNGHALYTKGTSRIYIYQGNNITFENEKIVSTGTSNSTTVPDPSGSGTTTGVYNYYYGLFSADGNLDTTGSSFTYKNITQDLSSITTKGTFGQPFYNIGMSVNFSGNNYFSYNSGEEFMEGDGINVLDGTTIIDHKTSKALIWPRNGNPAFIRVESGATLDITGDTTASTRGLFYLEDKPALDISNDGTLIIDRKMSNSAADFYSGTSASSISLNLGADSTTKINGYGLFDLGASSGPFTTTIGPGASFDYDVQRGAKIFAGTYASGDSFTMNSAKHVKFYTPGAVSSSILGTSADNSLFTLNATVPAGYAINGYDNNGSPTVTASNTSGAYGVTGTFLCSLSDLSSLQGIHSATAADVAAYQKSSHLEFNLVSPAQANFTYAWAADVPGQNSVPGKLQATLPKTLTENGIVDDAIPLPNLTVPDGYDISGCRAPDGVVYPSLADALAQIGDSYFDTSNSTSPDTYIPGTNDFQVILSAQIQTFYLNFGYMFNQFGNLPAFPPAANAMTGLTGAPLSLNPPQAPGTGYHYSAVRNKNTDFWIDKTNPETGDPNVPAPYYDKVDDAINAAVNDQNDGLFFGTHSLAAPPPVNNQGDFDNNVMLMITANTETAHYSYKWDSSTPGTGTNPGATLATLPSAKSSQGGFGDTIAADPDGADSSGNNYASFVKPPADIPLSGYYETVQAPGGTIYTADPDAIPIQGQGTTVIKTDNPLTVATEENTFKDGAAANDFSVTYTPILNKVTWHYQHDAAMPKPPADVVQNLLTGSPLPDPNTAISDGYHIESYQYPGDPTAYMSLTALQIAHQSGTGDITITVVLVKNLALPFAGGSGKFGLVAASGTALITGLFIYFRGYHHRRKSRHLR